MGLALWPADGRIIQWKGGGLSQLEACGLTLAIWSPSFKTRIATGSVLHKAGTRNPISEAWTHLTDSHMHTHKNRAQYQQATESITAAGFSLEVMLLLYHFLLAQYTTEVPVYEEACWLTCFLINMYKRYLIWKKLICTERDVIIQSNMAVAVLTNGSKWKKCFRRLVENTVMLLWLHRKTQKGLNIKLIRMGCVLTDSNPKVFYFCFKW